MPMLSRLAAFLAALTAAPALAAEPAAIVEDLAGPVAGLELLDYVEAGRVIELGGGSSVILGYLASCRRETIAGGRVTIGAKQSRVEGGRLTAETVTCDGAQLQLTQAQASKSAASVFRKGNPDLAGKLPPADVILYDTQPLVTLAPGVAELAIERLDAKFDPMTLPSAGHAIDFARLGRRLEKGGVYVLRAGAAERIIEIDAMAAEGKTPLLGRLIRM